tara:strand:+ start:2962 stop:3876 length:915 start_codon:yes stop_codon:yes gene_type:complete
MSQSEHSNLKELDIVEIVRICIQNKKTIILSLSILSLMIFLIVFNIINNIDTKQRNLIAINILFNHENEINKNDNILTKEDKSDLNAIRKTITPFYQRLVSPLNYESWMYENLELAKYFAQVETHKMEISEFNQILLEYGNKKEYEAIVSYVQHTILKQQNLLDQSFQTILKNNYVRMEKLKNDSLIFDRKLQFLKNLSSDNIAEREKYYIEYLKTQHDYDENLYLIDTLETRLFNLESSYKDRLPSISMGKVTTTPIFSNEPRVIDRYPYILFFLIPFFDVILLILLILYYRLKEEYLNRITN